MIKLNFKPEERVLRQFAWIAAIAGPLLVAMMTRGEARWYAAWAWHWTSTPVLVTAGIGVAQLLLFLAGIRKPTHWLYVVLMVVVYPLGFVLSHVLIALIYYVVVTPIALVFRAMGRDILGKQLDPRAKTYWRDRGEPRPASSYFKLY